MLWLRGKFDSNLVEFTSALNHYQLQHRQIQVIENVYD